ncbi:unnamed protein product, partial [Ectocarpus sp. 6 AP-2014]
MYVMRLDGGRRFLDLDETRRHSEMSEKRVRIDGRERETERSRSRARVQSARDDPGERTNTPQNLRFFRFVNPRVCKTFGVLLPGERRLPGLACWILECCSAAGGQTIR